MNRTGFVTLALAGLLLAPMARADEWKGGPWGPRAVKALGLTPDQVTKLKAIQEDRGKTQKPLWQQLGAQMKELGGLIKQKAADADLTAKMDQIKATREQIETNRKNFDEQEVAILTPMQHAKVMMWRARAMAKERKERGADAD